jgi:hypothetical protein
MSTYTTSLGLEEITPGDQAGLWGNTTNNNLALIDQAVTGVTSINFATLSGSTYTLTDYNGAVDEARSAVLNLTGNAAGTNTVVVPNKQKTYLVRNDTGQDVIFQTASPTTSYTVGNGFSILIFCNGNNEVFTGIAAPNVGPTLTTGGGTGLTTYTAGDLTYYATGTAFSKLGIGPTNYFLSSSGSAPQWTQTLGAANGGTGQSTLPSGSLLVGNGTGAVQGISPTGLNNYVLTSNGSSWVPTLPTSGGVTQVLGSGNITASPSTGVVTVSITPSPTFTNLSATTVSATGNITTSAGQVGTGTISSLGYSRMVGSSVQLFDGNSSIFGNQFGTVGIIANGATPIVGNTLAMGPGGDNTFSCGSSGLRWTAVWAVNGTIQTSDSRLKTNVTPSPLGLNFISKLKPISYKWISGAKVEDGTTTPTQIGGATVNMKNYKDRPGIRTHYGLIAQEVKQTLDELNVDDFAGWALENKDDPNSTQALNYGQFIAPLIKAVQELKAELDAAKAEIAELKAK